MSANLGSAEGSIHVEVGDAIANIGKLQSAFGSLGGSAENAFGRARDAGFALIGIGAAILGGLSLATNTAANFEQQMSAVDAVLGATDDQMAALSDTALRLGADTSFSATEAAAAIEELGKAGVGIEDILNGAAQGAVNLAAAAGTSVPQAAVVMATALNIFNLGGEQATHVADVFAAAANKSATDVDSLAQGLAQAGTVAASFGLSLEDTVGTLALFADNGLKGSDAGTSLKMMLTSLLDPTDKQTALMADLGLSFFDAQGNFIGLEGVAGELQAKLSGLTEEQRNTALAVLFGSDAVRAANILYKEGADGVVEYTAAVNDVGAAQEAANTRLDNFRGSLEQLKGSVETFAILIGSIFLPPLRDVVDVATRVVNVLIELPAPLQKIAAISAAVAGAFAAIAGGLILLAPRIIATVKAVKELRLAMAALAIPTGPILLIVAALAALGVAYKTNLFGFRDAVNDVAGKVKAAFGAIVDAVAPVAAVLGALFGTAFGGGATFTTQAASISAAVTTLTRIFGLNFDQARQLRSALTDLALPLRRMRNLFRDVTQGGLGFLKAVTGRASRRDLIDFHKRLDRLFGKDIGRRAGLATRDLARSLKRLGNAFEDAFDVDLGSILSLPAVLGGVGRAASGLVSFLRNDLMPVLGPVLVAVVNGAAAAFGFLADHMTEIAAVVRTLASLVGETLAAPFRALAALIRGDFGGALSVVTGLVGSFLDAGASLLGWILDVPVPTVAGWVTDNAGRAWDAIKEEAGWTWDNLADLGAWTLDTVVPAITGWLKGAAADVWSAVALAAGFIWTAVAELGGWTLHTLAPTVTGWLFDTAGHVWPALKAAAQWFFTEAAELGSWTLHTLLPTVTGWLFDTAEHVWPALKAAAQWFFTGVQELGGWTLHTAVPTITGWLSATAATVWPALKTAANWTWDGLAELGTWFLHTVVPIVTGWVTNAAQLPALLASKLGHPTINLGHWTLTVPTPDIAFESGFDLGTTIREKALALGRIYVDLPWYLQVGLAVGVVLLPFLPFVLAALILRKIGLVRIFNFTKWVLEVGMAATFGFVTGLVFGPAITQKLLDAAIAVNNFVDWTLEIGVPKTINLIGGLAESLGTLILDRLKNLPTLSIGKGAGGEGEEELRFEATVTVDVETAQQSINTLKESLDAFDGKTFTAILGLNSSSSTDTLNDFVIDLETGWETDTFTSTLALDLSGVTSEQAITEASTAGGALADAVGTGFAAKQEGGPANFLSQGQKVAEAISRGIDSGAPVALIAMGNLGIGLGNVIAEYQDDFEIAGQNVSVNMGAGITGASVAVENAARGAVGAAVQAAIDAGSGEGPLIAGQNIAIGIANGITSAVSAITNAAASAVSAGIEAAKTAAQIASPSKRTAREIGVPLGLGIAAGLAQTADPVKRAMRDLVGSIQTLSAPANAALTAQLRAMPARTGGGGGGLTVVNHNYALTGRDLGDLLSQSDQGSSAHRWIAESGRMGPSLW